MHPNVAAHVPGRYALRCRSVSVEPSLALAGVAGLAGLAFLLASLANLRLRRLRRACSVLQGDAEHSSFIVAVARHTAEMERLRRDVGRMRAELGDIRAAIDESLRRVAVLRYDAFGDMGGMLSWSIALLDEQGDGVVITSIAGRSETRTYAKSLTAGRAEHGMSPEEERVVRAAMRSAPVAAVSAGAAR
jgi:hypothetical protein